MPLTLARQLRALLPPEAVIDDPLRLGLYGYDGTLFEGRPALAVLPETTAQVVAVVRACHEAGVPVVPRGAATSLSGGPVPVEGGVVVGFSRMDRILELDYPNQRAVVQPGVINLDLQNAVAASGYFYAPDPSSQSVCTLGGNVAENSGGPHCLKYGVTANHVIGLELVLADGQVMRTGGKALDWPGYDLTGVIVGSEGTFGLVTEITCRLMPQPQAVATMLAIFNSLEAAGEAVSGIIAAGIVPATLEMMDKAMIRAVEMGLQCGYPLDAEAVLIIELDGLQAGLGEQVEQVQAVCESYQATEFRLAQDEFERALLWKGRKGAFGAVGNIAPTKICTDISVPRTELPQTLAQVMEIGRKWDLAIANVFHAGDGNLHPLVLYDPRDQDQARRAAAIEHEITELAVARGGVLTGEHGIGCCKRPYMSLMFSPAELAALGKIKDAFDPEHRLNPGKVLPDMEGPSFSWPQRGPAEARPLHAPGDQIVEYNHANLTITVQAGGTLPQIDEAVAARGQMLPLRPRFADRATIGEIIAAGESGPHRLLYGGPRDLITGVKVRLADGEVVKFGGSCVKNVAGYAAEKLFIGSRGELGTIIEATLRTLPRPEIMRTLALSIEMPAALQPFLSEFLASPLRPAALELLNPAASGLLADSCGRWTLLAGLEGFSADVEEMAQWLQQAAARHGLSAWQPLDQDYRTLWAVVTDLGSGPETPMLKASCLLTATTDLAQELSNLNTHLPLRAAPGLGLVHCTLSGTTDSSAYANQAQALAPQYGGAISWLAPLQSETEGLPAAISRRLKEAFDPTGILP